ncbi:metal ABC transporter substrate-binding protein [Nocardioides sp. TRM66260-LWL]|uniref:metal ABC transporter substrate-binding protein n=1 Tax=Nocardioides sp. TRM66260-LWL TaxID=2874478 RepID=UPI001CC82A54|nr:metal ABC transporter substrate-binding protein [Nocardioides sp. TRM66260-LWL]MBZ5735850.1 metal ABC transporter substrate-binding protein [Nocardioides sp. TRM66260-LWL]
MKIRRPGLAAGLVALVATGALSGCAAFSDDAAGGPAASGGDGRVQVVAAFYPLQFVSQRVGGDLVDVTDLTKPGAEPHDLELDPRQNASVVSGDLVVYEKGLQASVDAAVEQRPAGRATLDVVPAARLTDLSHDGHDDAAHDHGGEEETGLGDLDPHFWLDPTRLADVADAVAASLSEVAPDHAAQFRANAAALRADLEQVDAEFERGLGGCRRETIVVSHNAFGYWDRYGLDIEPISGLSPDAEPTPADLARLQDLIRSDGITTVFGETLVSPKQSETLARDMGVSSAVLDPIEGLTDRTADQDYLSIMRSNLDALRKANGCR